MKNISEIYVLPNVKVKKLMTEDIVTVSEDDSLETLIKKFQKFPFPSFPVLNKTGKLVGVISKADFFSTFSKKKIRQVFASHVKDIMSSGLVTVDPETHVVDAANLMLRQGVRLLPVVKDDVVVGVLSYTDILNHIVKHKE